jgi:hypothetical protein
MNQFGSICEGTTINIQRSDGEYNLKLIKERMTSNFNSKVEYIKQSSHKYIHHQIVSLLNGLKEMKQKEKRYYYYYAIINFKSDLFLKWFLSLFLISRLN